MALSGPQKRALRALAHHLDPVVRIGAARVTPGVLTEVARALVDHELIKARLIDAKAEEVVLARQQLLEGTGAELVQTLGHTIILFRRNAEDPKLAALPGETLARAPKPPEAARKGRPFRR